VKLWKYIKSAFSNHWNLLGLAGGLAFTAISGQWAVGLPLLAAAEFAWLGFVGTHPKFQLHIDMQEHGKRKAEEAAAAKTRARMMLSSLPRGAQRRYEQLMEQCQEMRTITKNFQAAQGTEIDAFVVESRLEGLDRLLWLYLKLLHTEHSLNRFFETTTIVDIEREIKQIQTRLEREESRSDNQQRERIVATLKDSLKTCLERKQNFEQARDSFELVKAEERRLENKIRSLAETGISKGDSGLLSGQVDIVAGSIQDTERTLSQLEFVTGFSTFDDEAVPEMVKRRVTAN